MSTTYPCVLLFFIGLAFAAPHRVAAEDWPQWRGLKRDGISPETGLLKSWGSNGPAVLWMARGIGSGYSSVAVVGNRIYTMGDAGDSSFVHALNAAEKGKIAWSSRVGKPGGGGGYAGPRATPTVDGERVYVLGQFGDLVCLKATDGKEVWHKNLKADLGGEMMSHWGYSESVLVDGENVICTPGGKSGTLAALDRRTGDVVWRSTELTDRAAYASTIPVEIGGVRQYIQLTDASVAGIAAENGKLLWQAPRRGSTAVIPTPVYKDGHVFVTSGYRVGCNLFRIGSNGGKFSATQVYANHDFENHHGGVVLLGDYIYGHSDSRGWTCMEFKTGNVIWSSPGIGKGSVTAVDGKLICRSEKSRGTIALVEASPDGYKELSRFDQPERGLKEAWPHPVVSGGRLYIRDMDVLLCFDLKKK
ncbi:MAG: outer membrane protein assembly factor BamB [Verrucomicrobiota bacterium]|jgi:outer membrane protein assembly factor BamB